MDGADDLSALAGKPVRFRFHLRNGSLYSFWVSPETSGASHGYVAAGGPGFTGPADTVGQAAYVAAHTKWRRPHKVGGALRDPHPGHGVTGLLCFDATLRCRPRSGTNRAKFKGDRRIYWAIYANTHRQCHPISPFICACPLYPFVGMPHDPSPVTE